MKKGPFYKEELLWGTVLLLPSMLGLTLFYVYPFFENIYNSFSEISFLGNKTWVGLRNYLYLWKEPRLLQSFMYTFKYAVVTAPIVLSLSLVMAAILNQKLRAIRFYRVVFYLPVVAMPIAIATVWKWMFNFDYGFLNEILAFFQIQPIPWLREKDTFFLSLVVVSSWSKVGYNILLLLAGLQTIPDMYYEAAMIDGAGLVKRFFKITLPLLSPTIFFITIINMISFLQVFEWIYALANLNSPIGQANSSVITLFYELAFISNQKGEASALSVIFFVVIFILTLIQFKMQKKWVHYEQ